MRGSMRLWGGVALAVTAVTAAGAQEEAPVARARRYVLLDDGMSGTDYDVVDGKPVEEPAHLLRVLDTFSGDVLTLDPLGVLVSNVTTGAGSYRAVESGSLDASAAPQGPLTGPRFTPARRGVFDAATGRLYRVDAQALRVLDPVGARILVGPRPDAIQRARQERRRLHREHARLTPDRGGAIGMLHRIFRAEVALQRDLDGPGRFGLLDRLIGAKLIPLEGDAQFGYRFEVNVPLEAADQRWQAIARPLRPGPGLPHLMVNHTGKIYTSTTPFQPNDACAPHAEALLLMEVEPDRRR